MPVNFESHSDENYFLSIWTGKVTDTELVESYKRFFNSLEWIPGMNELADLSNLDLSEVTQEGLRDLAEFAKELYERNNMKDTITAAYCPHDLQFGMLRVYEALAEESPEAVKVFRDFDKAKEWLLSNQVLLSV